MERHHNIGRTHIRLGDCAVAQDDAKRADRGIYGFTAAALLSLGALAEKRWIVRELFRSVGSVGVKFVVVGSVGSLLGICKAAHAK
jgi:hypothetical protein